MTALKPRPTLSPEAALNAELAKLADRLDYRGRTAVEMKALALGIRKIRGEIPWFEPKPQPKRTTVEIEISHASPMNTTICSAVPIPGHDSRPLVCTNCGTRLGDGAGHWADEADGIPPESAAPWLVRDSVPTAINEMAWGRKLGHVTVCATCHVGHQEARARLSRKRKVAKAMTGNFGPSEDGR